MIRATFGRRELDLTAVATSCRFVRYAPHDAVRPKMSPEVDSPESPVDATSPDTDCFDERGCGGGRVKAMDQNKLDEIASASASKHELRVQTKPFGSEWGTEYWGKWQTIAYALYGLGVQKGATILDRGMGVGWTTVFLAESGFRPTGIDIAPASAAIALDRGARYHAEVDAVAADMDTFDLGRTFDAALVFDALHHSTRQAAVIARIAAHLKPDGWALFGEPSWLHGLSPHARRTSLEEGWVERGVRVRTLKQDCAAAWAWRLPPVL